MAEGFTAGMTESEDRECIKFDLKSGGPYPTVLFYPSMAVGKDWVKMEQMQLWIACKYRCMSVCEIVFLKKSSLSISLHNDQLIQWEFISPCLLCP